MEKVPCQTCFLPLFAVRLQYGAMHRHRLFPARQSIHARADQCRPPNMAFAGMRPPGRRFPARDQYTAPVRGVCRLRKRCTSERMYSFRHRIRQNQFRIRAFRLFRRELQTRQPSRPVEGDRLLRAIRPHHDLSAVMQTDDDLPPHDCAQCVRKRHISRFIFNIPGVTSLSSPPPYCYRLDVKDSRGFVGFFLFRFFRRHCLRPLSASLSYAIIVRFSFMRRVPPSSSATTSEPVHPALFVQDRVSVPSIKE